MHRVRNWRQRVPLLTQAAIDIARDTIGTGINYAAHAYQQYDYHRRVARHTENLQRMPPTRSRSRGRNRMRSRSTSTVPSLPFTPANTGRRGRSTVRGERRAARANSQRARRQLVFGRNRRRRPLAVSADRRVAAGAFTNKFKKVKISKYSGKNGVVSKQEFGSSISDANAVYLGHALPLRLLQNHLARNIVKVLYTKAGNEIPAWESGPPFDALEQHLIQVEWYSNVNSTTGILTNTTASGTGNSYDTIAGRLNDVLAGVQVGNTAGPVRFGVITLFSISGTDRRVMSQINMQRVHVDFIFNSQLKIQNVTEASTGEEANDELVTHVEANPLIGKHYYRTEWKNGFDVHWRPGANINWIGFYANPVSGIIESGADDANTGTGQSYNKPPPPFAFNTTMSDGVQIQPGEIKTSFINFKTHIMWQNMYDKVYKMYTDNSALTRVINFGTAKMVGLEKLLDSRLASDANVTLQFEVMQKLSSTMVEVKRGTLPYVNIL